MIPIQITCPIHGGFEIIEFPDSYLGSAMQNTFDGEVQCAAADAGDRRVLLIKATFYSTGDHTVQSVTSKY